MATVSSNKSGVHPAASTIHAVGGTVSSADATAAAALAAVHERTASGSSTPPSLPPATVTSATDRSTSADATPSSLAATAEAEPATEATGSTASAALNNGSSSSNSSSKNNSSADANKSTDPSSEKHNHPHHIIFVVHGMGRQLEEFGNYERNVGHLVENTRLVLQNQFFEHRTDVHIIPIEWHAKLHSMVDQRMSLATLKTVPKVRLIMNDYFADILYYFNSHYGGEITKFIVDELNEAYSTFMAKHPHFNGKIAIYALSLGGVAMYDILTCQDDIEDEPSEEPTETISGKTLTEAQIESKRLRKENSYKYRAIMNKLKFRPHYLFTVGSPVGAVMVMRNLEWSYFHPPDDIIHHNIFHPFDPLGYRIEPLIDPVFSMIPPVTTTPFSISQSILPTISLPSLPSLSNLPIPESISSFWEQKVPSIPKSIPSLRTISQVAQALKSASWRTSNSGSTSGGNSMLKSDASIDAEISEAGGSVAGETEVSAGSDSGKGSHQQQEQQQQPQQSHPHPHNQVPPEDDKDIMMSSDADATAGEAIVAAAAMAYFDQDLSNRAPTSMPSSSTTNGLAPEKAAGEVPDGRPRPGRRPSLGPRKISNRMDFDSKLPTEKEEDADGDEESASHKKLKASVKDASDDDAEMIESKHGAATSHKEYDRPAPKLDDVLDRHQSMEKARLESAASSPTLPSSEADRRRPSISSTRANREQTYPFPLLVQGRPTAVPYRIDHSLQETKVDQYTNEYLLGMRSHFRYWANRDIAYHILKHLLHEPGKPLDDEQKVPDGPLDLQLNMPAPVKTPRGVREAAEAKAKLAAAALQQQQQQQQAKDSGLGSSSTTSTSKQQRRQSSSYSASLAATLRQEHDEEDFMMG
ncbi:hypothetical protein BGW41_005678, partial [Actinomortierella wolfii]